MGRLGETIRKLRREKELPLRKVASYLDIDQAILSKIERSQRNATRLQVIKLAKYFGLEEIDLIVLWLADKLKKELENEEGALQALQAAEESIAYKTFNKTDRKKIVQLLSQGLKNFPLIEKAWIYGSFARGDDSPKSDIDVALKTSDLFSYFDLAEVQFHLEKLVNRKVDVGFIDSFKSYVLEHVKSDLKLIYER